MKILKVIITFSMLGFLIDCSNKEESSSAQDNTTQIDKLKEENQKLKDELQQLNSDYSVYLQQFDSTSRTIIRLIKEEQYEQIKKEYNTNFEVSNGEIIFNTPEDVISAGFPIEQAKFPMSIAYLNLQTEKSEIGYYLDDLENGERFLITFVYDQNGDFQYIYIGEV
ncbi:hypothetical protein [Ureibacillus aquaedulcis]|uniref:Lipoprotein n=1 Tax=Ureibacillus aquaedulcis TaxID=3058421 RepID=A0ABT8GSV2_9BACL|nr:hypothetical protein [Ureibacillus sp. BA0131]MDN4494492.1 hypothetical protein [Ureibacillus sp. BA0131]